MEARKAFVLVVNNFIGCIRARNYVEFVKHILIAFENLGCSISIKMHYLFTHKNWFTENLGSMSNENGEMFHQDIKKIEPRN